jgi:hypothetical protein
MPNVIEPAPSGRSKCRGCAQTIARDALRFGERLPNPFGDGEMTLWFHPECAAYKRPEPLLATLLETAGEVPARQRLEETARRAWLIGVFHESMALNGHRAEKPNAVIVANPSSVGTGAFAWCFMKKDSSLREVSFTSTAARLTSRPMMSGNRCFTSVRT